MVALTDKQVTVSVVDPDSDGQPRIEMLSVAKGTTVGRFKESLDLGSDWKLSFPGEKELPDQLDIYELVTPKKNQLVATPNMDVGTNRGPSGPPTLSSVRRLTPPVPRRVAPALDVSPVRPPVILTPPTPKRVTPVGPPLWQQEGWQQMSADMLTGNYITPYRSYPGYIRQDGSHFIAGIYEKPPEIEAHLHARCLWTDGPYWYLHFNRPAKGPDAALQGMTHFLIESYCLAHPTKARFKDVLKRSFNF